MPRLWISASLLGASLTASGAAFAEAAPTVIQLRLPARDLTADTFAWRDGGEVLVERDALAALNIIVPASVQDDRVALDAIPGLRFIADDAAAAIVITCSAACFATQRIGADDQPASPPLARASGVYLNYDLNGEWVDGHGSTLGGIGEAALFGRWGLIDSSWLISDAHSARLETSWTIDDPARRVRLRLGDSIAADLSGAPFRFAGIQIGRDFSLAPSMITYPTPALSGEAQSASTVELYIDGALRARQAVQAGPFEIDNAPLVAGGGEAQLVVTDLLGREQILSRPFFISTSLLRPGLSDWSLSLGSMRERYGAASFDYSDSMLAATYRRGLTDALTGDIGIDARDGAAGGRIGVTFAAPDFGQFSLSHARSGGRANTASYYFDARTWSFGAQMERRDTAFRALSDDGALEHLRSSAAVSVGLNLGDWGSASVTGASLSLQGEPTARTFALSYTPDFADGALSLRLLYTERETRDLSVGLSWSFRFGADASGSFDAEQTPRGNFAGVSAQRAPPPHGGVGWRARAVWGAQSRLEADALYRSALGDGAIETALVNDVAGVRASHAGSIGWIDGEAFAGPPIDGAFAVVDAGAAHVAVSRDHLPVGVSGADGRVLVTGLHAYDANLIAIDVDDLPLDRAPTSVESRVTPAQGAGVVIRFAEAAARMIDTRAAFADGRPAPRGAILVRTRDGARFPIGSNGRVSLRGEAAGDLLTLSTDPNCTAAPVAQGLLLTCRAAS